MKTEKITVADITSLQKTVMQHGGGKGSLAGAPSDIEDMPCFICRIECNDGVVIDFYAPDAESFAQFPPEIVGDTNKIIEKSIKDFVELVSDPDPFVSIIKGQAYIEALITSMLESAFLEPSELEIDRMTFTAKIKYCVAAGLIHREVAHVLKAFAKIRNGFAHQIWPVFTERERKDFLNVLRQSRRLREKLPSRENVQPEVFDCVWAMWIYLFEQSCRLATQGELLSDFWKKMVDAKAIAPLPVTVFVARPITP